MKRTFHCELIDKIEVNHEVYKLILNRPRDMGEIRSGQFHNLSINQAGFPYLKRPISVSDVTEDRIEFTIKVNGGGTELLKNAEVGKTIEVLGPLGNGFDLGPKSEKSLVVGGGIGVAPVKLLVKEIKEARNVEVDVLLGFREAPYEIKEFEAFSKNIKIATETGQVGHKGYVTKHVIDALDANQFDMVYVCGPHMMLKAVAEICNERKVPVQLLMEERMACGIGACLVCTCKIKDESKEAGYWNKRMCKDGPVFMGDEVIFDD